MAYDFKYNPLDSQLDIVGSSSAANGGGGKFVGVTGLMAVGSGSWARIAQIQFNCDNIQDEAKKTNICFDGVFYVTKQNASPYTHEFYHKAAQIDLHIEIPYITDLNDNSNHYSRAFVAITDCVGFAPHEIELVETAHVVADGKAYAYFELFCSCNNIYDRYFYSFITNASKDQYNRIKVVPNNGDLPEYIPYGTGFRVYVTPYRADFTQEVAGATTITIPHYLNTYPAAVIFDANGNQVLADVVYTDKNTLTINFTEAFTGTIYLK